jgi:hypothetical protein
VGGGHGGHLGRARRKRTEGTGEHAREKEDRGEGEAAAGGPYPLVWAVGGGVHLLAGSTARARARTCFQLEEDDDWRSLGRATAGLRQTEGKEWENGLLAQIG